MTLIATRFDPEDEAAEPQAGWLAIVVVYYLVLLLLEYFYLQDRFRGELVRYNSYFKFSYPVWAPLCVLGVLALQRMSRTLWGVGAVRLAPLRRGMVVALVGAFILAAGVYTPMAMTARIMQARRGDEPARRPTLNGFDYIRHRVPFAAELPMIEWLRENTPPGTRVAEAGAHLPREGAYTYGGRVASLAGRAVPLGWQHHELQWRGPAAMAMIEERKQALDSLYEAGTPEDLLRRARTLGVDFAVYGLVEAQHYGRGALDRLRAAGTVAARFAPPPLWQLGPEAAAELPAIYVFDLRDTDGQTRASARGSQVMFDLRGADGQTRASARGSQYPQARPTR